jgi:hypothetical protein
MGRRTCDLSVGESRLRQNAQKHFHVITLDVTCVDHGLRVQRLLTQSTQSTLSTRQRGLRGGWWVQRYVSSAQIEVMSAIVLNGNHIRLNRHIGPAPHHTTTPHQTHSRRIGSGSGRGRHTYSTPPGLHGSSTPLENTMLLRAAISPAPGPHTPPK